MEQSISLYDEFRARYSNASPEQKLAALKSESLPLLDAIDSCIARLEAAPPAQTQDLPDDFREWFRTMTRRANGLRDLLTDPHLLDGPAEQSLIALGYERMSSIAMIGGYAEILMHDLEANDVRGLPTDFENWCRQISQGARDLADVFDALVLREDRELIWQRRAEQKRAYTEEQWARLQDGLPELKPYRDLWQAINETAQRLRLTPIDPALIDIRPYRGTMLNFWMPSRLSDIIVTNMPDNRQYHLQLARLIDRRNRRFAHYDGKTSSLEEATTVIVQWMVSQWSLDDIRQAHPSMAFRFQPIGNDTSET